MIYFIYNIYNRIQFFINTGLLTLHVLLIILINDNAGDDYGDVDIDEGNALS